MKRGKNFRTTGKSKRTFQDQILSEGTYADPQAQALYDEHILSLCHKAALNAWNRIQELGKRIESYTRVKKAKENPLMTFYKDYLRLYKQE